jgi:hypothetical protein
MKEIIEEDIYSDVLMKYLNANQLKRRVTPKFSSAPSPFFPADPCSKVHWHSLRYSSMLMMCTVTGVQGMHNVKITGCRPPTPFLYARECR